MLRSHRRAKGGPLVVKQHADQFTKHHGDPSHVTADFTPENHGCLRIDYVLPSRGLEVVKGGIFWPTPASPGRMPSRRPTTIPFGSTFKPTSEKR